MLQRIHNISGDQNLIDVQNKVQFDNTTALASKFNNSFNNNRLAIEDLVELATFNPLNTKKKVKSISNILQHFRHCDGDDSKGNFSVMCSLPDATSDGMTPLMRSLGLKSPSLWMRTLMITKMACMASQKPYLDLNMSYNNDTKLKSQDLFYFLDGLTEQDLLELFKGLINDVYTSFQHQYTGEDTDKNIKVYVRHNQWRFESDYRCLMDSLKIFTVGHAQYESFLNLNDNVNMFNTKNVGWSTDSTLINRCAKYGIDDGCIKVIINVCKDHVKKYSIHPLANISKSEHVDIQAKTTKIYDHFVKKNVSYIKYKNSYSIPNSAIELYLSDLTQLNIIKLFAVKNYKILLPKNIFFHSIDEFDRLVNALGAMAERAVT